MQLNKDIIKDISNMAEHYLNNMDDTDYELRQQYTLLYNLVTGIPKRFTIEIKRVELVPDTKDPIINACMKHLLDLLENDDTYNCDESLALQSNLWRYLLKEYKFNHKDHELFKYTVEEAFSLAFRYIEIVR